MSLRFCFLTTFYPPYNFGGDGIGIQRLARGLAKAGHHVTVVHDAEAYKMLAGKEPKPYSDPQERLSVIPLTTRLGVVSNLLTQQTGRPIVNGHKIRRILNHGRFDVVNFHNVSLIGGPGLLSYGANAIRLYMAHEHWLVCPTHVLWKHKRERCETQECTRCMVTYRRPPQLYRYNGYMTKQLDQVDTFIAMSEFSRQKHREFGFPKEMEVVPYFLPDAPTGEKTQTASPHDRPYFLFVGRLEKIKGLDDVIPLLRNDLGADLLIAGDGEYTAELKRQAQGLDAVKFLGRIPVDELKRYYEHARALIVPSVCFETFGIILIEAFRYGTPVIARRLGPFPEIVEGAQGGRLFSTSEELLEAMRLMLNNPEARQKMADDGHRAFQERWSESVVVPSYLKLVQRTAARKGVNLDITSVTY